MSNNFGNRTNWCCDHSYTVSKGLYYCHRETFDEKRMGRVRISVR